MLYLVGIVPGIGEGEEIALQPSLAAAVTH
jgi:hypothetical protein